MEKNGNQNGDSDHALMRQYLNGEVKAFTQIYELYHRKVYTYLFRRVKRSQDADELLQAVFLKFHQTRHQFTFEHSLLQWLYVISRSIFIDYYRKEKASQDTVLKQDGFEEIAIAAPTDFEDQISFSVIEGLPQEQQDIIRSRLIDDESYNEIASRLKKSETSIRQIFSRAMKKLKTQILLERENEQLKR